jgi:hypothetical protein
MTTVPKHGGIFPNARVSTDDNHRIAATGKMLFREEQQESLPSLPPRTTWNANL